MNSEHDALMLLGSEVSKLDPRVKSIRLSPGCHARECPTRVRAPMEEVTGKGAEY